MARNISFDLKAVHAKMIEVNRFKYEDKKEQCDSRARNTTDSEMVAVA